jgi:hypothetical protein
MTTSTVAPEIAKFAAAVREALADLPEEERDELTDGLEADLSESLAEDLRRTLPDPVVYAAELRAAAGLPARARKRGTFAGLAQSGRDTLTDVRIAIRRNPALAGALDFAETLRPLWWVIRAWVAAWILAAFFGMERGYWFDGAWWIVFAAFLVVSVQWGRGRWLRTGVPTLIIIGNVIAVLALLPIRAATDNGAGNGGNGAFTRGYSAGADSVLNDAPTKGLIFNGKPLQNIYAYDAQGRPLHHVQLFDQSGHPLDPFSHAPGEDQPCADDNCVSLIQAARLETGQQAFNVFPLSLIRGKWDDEQGATIPAPGASATEPKGPFLKVPAVLTPKKVAKSTH